MHTFGASSQQDLISQDLALTRLVSNSSPLKSEEGTDIDARGKDLATRCWEEDAEFLHKEKIAEWLGGRLVVTAFFRGCKTITNRT